VRQRGDLLLARSESRRKEIAVRVAIGAGWPRLLGQSCGRYFALLGGAALGLLVAFGGLRVLVNTNAGSLPRVSEMRIDGRCWCSGGLQRRDRPGIGLAPLIHMRASKLHDTLNSRRDAPRGRSPRITSAPCW